MQDSVCVPRFLKKEFSLNAGDSIQIPAGVNHLWNNEWDEEAKVVFAITPPSF